MNHPHHSIGTSLTIHGIHGIDTHYKTSKLMADVNTHQMLSNLRDTGASGGVRHRVGQMMIALGAAVAGTTHDLQGRQATMPSRAARSGAVPTL